MYFGGAGLRKCQLYKDWDGDSDLTGHYDGEADTDNESIMMARMSSVDDVLVLADALQRAAELMATLKAEYKAAV